MSVYLLVHPEPYAEDLSLFTGWDNACYEDYSSQEYHAELDYMLTAWEKAVREKSDTCDHKLAVLYDDFEDGPQTLLGELTTESWKYVEADGFGVVNAALDLVADYKNMPIILAGTTREDCIARVFDELTRCGYSVNIHEQATFPPDNDHAK